MLHLNSKGAQDIQNIICYKYSTNNGMNIILVNIKQVLLGYICHKIM